MKHHTLPAGLHNIPAAIYHADPAPRPSLSSTIGRILLNQSPLHAWTASPRLNPDHEPTDRKTFDIGRAAHRAVLGKGDSYEAVPDELLSSSGAISTKAAKEWVAEARERGVTPLKPDEVDLIDEIAERVRRRLALARMTLDPARSEITALAEIGGTWCRAMIDNAPEGAPYLVDFKTTTDASPEACVRAVQNYGYDVQAAHYIAVWEAVTGEKRRMRFVFTEKEPPFETSIVELHDVASDESDWMLDAEGKCAEARRIWRECLAAGEWPGYPARVAVIGAPKWHRDRWAARETGRPVIEKPSPAAMKAAAQMFTPEGAR